MALRNLFAHKVKSFIVGALMAFGTFVFVFGTAMLDSVEGTMTESITSSIAGHLQIYDADAKDELSLFGSGYMSADDVGHIPDFAQVKAALADTPGVQAVVPMGLGFSMVSSPSDLDRRVAALRLAHAEGRGADVQAGTADFAPSFGHFGSEPGVLTREGSVATFDAAGLGQNSVQ